MAFKWFDKINHTGPFKVVGYATEKVSVDMIFALASRSLKRTLFLN